MAKTTTRKSGTASTSKTASSTAGKPAAKAAGNAKPDAKTTTRAAAAKSAAAAGPSAAQRQAAATRAAALSSKPGAQKAGTVKTASAATAKAPAKANASKESTKAAAGAKPTSAAPTKAAPTKAAKAPVVKAATSKAVGPKRAETGTSRAPKQAAPETSATAAVASTRASPAAASKAAAKAPSEKASTTKASQPKPAGEKKTARAAAGKAEKPAASATAEKTADTSPVAGPAAAASSTPVAEDKPAKAGRGTGGGYAKKPWLASYPKGIPSEITPLSAPSIGDLLVESCRRYAGREAFTCMDKTLKFSEIEKLSASFGAYLQSRGLRKGARVALMMPNVLQYPIAMMGVLRAGYTVVNVNPLYTPRELEHQLKDSGAEAIVILENFASTLQAVIAKTGVKHVVVAAMGDLLGLKGVVVNLVVRRVRKMVPAWSLPGHVTFNQALKTGEKVGFKSVKVEPDDVAFLQYTGGTTGISKGAVLLHRNVLANVAQNALWIETAFIKRQRPDRQTYICALPLYHIYALTVNAVMGMQQGAHNILIPNPRDIPAFVKEFGKYPINVFPGLNTLFNALLNNADFQKLDFKSLILTFGGGMAVQSGVAERWKKLTGTVISEGYGLSETAPVATSNRGDAEEFSGTIGLPIPSTEIAILDEDGKEVPLGEVGEIAIRGPQVMAGYWNRPDETAKVMTADGFFKSGDMGFMNPEGYVKIVDRKKDMILVSGFNVYPNELEDVVAAHPGVMEVAAIGIPDEKSGEVPKLFVVKKDPSLTEADLLEFCKDKLTAYKRPRSVEFRTELPKTNVGKILRRELRN